MKQAVVVAVVVITVLAYLRYRTPPMIALKARSGRYYQVRPGVGATERAEILDRLHAKMSLLVRDQKSTYPLLSRWKGVIGETPNLLFGVALTHDKGRLIQFCLDSTSENTLMYVALHELAHVASKTTGHTEEFWTTYHALIARAIQLGVYKYQDFENIPRTYCGVGIHSTPYQCPMCADHE